LRPSIRNLKSTELLVMSSGICSEILMTKYPKTVGFSIEVAVAYTIPLSIA
jgi:hypothetical protein